jgi:hypothetical protein
MRPEDRPIELVDVDAGVSLPVDADLEALDAELAAAGAHARRTLFGRSQPTRVFSNQLRARLLETLEPPVGTTGLGELVLPRDTAHEIRVAPRVQISGETPGVGGRDDDTIRSPAPISLRAVLAFLSILGMAVVLALVALGGPMGSPLP